MMPAVTQSAVAPQPVAASAPITTTEDAVYPTFALLAVATIFLQKFAIVFGPPPVAPALGINTGFLWVGLIWLMWRGQAEITAWRFGALVALVVAMLVGLIANSWPNFFAMGVLVMMYSSLVVRVRVSRDVARRCFNAFQTCMVVIAVIVLGQQVLQYTIGNQYWPDIDRVTPPNLLYPGFAYRRLYAFQSPYVEPNGVFFLEPSVLSLYLAIAVGIELAWFRRPLRVVLYFGAMLACLAGSGPLALIASAPVWMFKLGRRFVFALLIVGVPLFAGALATDAFSFLMARSSELSNENSSGYARIIVPLQSAAEDLDRPGSLLSGYGPGSSTKGLNVSPWPFTKLLHEYGLATAVLFHVFLLACMLDGPPIAALSVIMLVPVLFFGGGLVSHATVMPLMLFGSLLRIQPSEVDRP